MALTSFMTWFLIIVQLYFRCQAVLEIDTQECEDGWLKFRDPNGRGLCVLIVEEPAPWGESRQTCMDRLATLIYLDKIRDYTIITGEKTSFIADALFDRNITEFWSGMYVEKGRLMWHEKGPRLMTRQYYGHQWSWGTDQPDPKAGDCGMATIETRSIRGFTVATSTLNVSLEDCTTALPFVCQKSPIELEVKTTWFCGNNWVGNMLIPRCYRIFKDPVTSPEAETRCRDEGGQLASANTNFDETFISYVFNFYKNFDQYFDVTRVEQFWVENKNGTQVCSAYDETGVNFQRPPGVSGINCSKTLLYMCSRPTTFPGFAEIGMDSPYFDQKELLQYDPFQILPVSGYYERSLQESEIIFFRTPSFILNSSLSYYQWDYSGNTVGWRVTESDRVSAPYYVNISIPYTQREPARRKRQVEGSGTIMPDISSSYYVDYDYVRLTTGYYSLGIYSINPPRYEETDPRLVRYSERYLYIYVVYLDLQDGVIGSEPNSTIDIWKVNSFNLLNDDGYIGLLYKEGGLYNLLDSTPQLLQGLVTYFRGQTEAIQDNTAKFRIFVAPLVSQERIPVVSEQVVYSAILDFFKEEVSNNTWKPETLQVLSTVNCPFTQTNEDGKNLTFNPTKIGQKGFSWERCYPDNRALAMAECNGGYDDGATWGQITLAGNCGVIPQLNKSESTTNLKNLSETTLTEDNFRDIIQQTVDLTDPVFNLTEADIIYAADILYKYLKLDSANTKEVMANIFKVVDNVLKASTGVIDSAQKITNAANRIILSVDELTNNLNLVGSDVVQFLQDRVVSEIWEQYGDGNLTIGIELNTTGITEIKKDYVSSVQREDDVTVTETDTAIFLTEALLKGQDSRLTFHIYGNPDLFSVISSRFKVNSKVAAARLTRNDTPVLDLGTEYVTAVFYPFEKSDKLVCAYWNYSKNEDAGGWETGGCTLFSYESGRVVCKCNHLTNFAVLIDQRANQISATDKLVLGIITKVGLIISEIALGITILTFLVFKHLRNGRGQQVLVNLSVAMFCSDILFLVGVDRTESRAGCIVVAVLLHYFILVTFMWMLVEGVLQYLRFVKVLGTYIPNFMKKSMIPAWGIPLIPVVICLAIDYDMYYGGNGYCWLSWKPFLYAFIIPVAVVILANFIIFFMVLCNLCCRRKHKGMASNQSERKMAFLHFQAAISILVILGLTWVFGFLTVDDTRIVFHYLFAIFNAFQGLFIFLLFTAREKQIRKAWKKMCCRSSPYKTSTSGTDSQPRKQSTDTNSTSLFSKSGGSNPGSTINGHGDFANGNNALYFSNKQYENGM